MNDDNQRPPVQLATGTSDVQTRLVAVRADIERRFTAHSPSPKVAERMESVREAGKTLAALLDEVVPPGDELAQAIRHVDMAVMLANAGIVRPSDRRPRCDRVQGTKGSA